MNPWQPIETARKDGTPILATWIDSWPKHPNIRPIFYNQSRGRWCYVDASWIGVGWEPTHWMPLPEAPEHQEEPQS